jgi:hypothetical protein
LSTLWDYVMPRKLMVSFDREYLFYDCIILLMERKLYPFHAIDRVAILQQWQVFFGELFETTQDYFELATESIRFIDHRINSWIWYANHGHTAPPPAIDVHVVPDTNGSW